MHGNRIFAACAGVIAGLVALAGAAALPAAADETCNSPYMGVVHHRVAEDAELRSHVRLVSLSFDPARDTPEVMRHYAAGAPSNGVEWAFLTTERPRTSRRSSTASVRTCGSRPTRTAVRPGRWPTC